MNSDNNNNRHSNHHSSDPDIDDNQCSTPVPNITFPFLPGPPTHHSTHLLSPTTGSTMIADTGCTAHFVSPSTPVWHAKPADPPVHVRNPNGSVMTSTHQAELAIPGLPPRARTAHVLPDLKSGPLLSIGQLCDAGCDVHFDRGTVTVSHGHTTVLTGSRTADTKLWQIPLPEPPRHQGNATIGLPSIAEQVAFSHAALFSPALSTLETALKKRFLVYFPGLSPETLRRHPPRSIPMHKGHMDQVRKGVRSTKTSKPEPDPSPSSSSPTKSLQDNLDDIESDFPPHQTTTRGTVAISSTLLLPNHRPVGSTPTRRAGLSPHQGVDTTTSWSCTTTTVTPSLSSQ